MSPKNDGKIEVPFYFLENLHKGDNSWKKMSKKILRQIMERLFNDSGNGKKGINCVHC